MEPSIYLGRSALFWFLMIAFLAGVFFLFSQRSPHSSSSTPSETGSLASDFVFFFLMSVSGSLLSLGLRDEGPQLYRFLYDHLLFWDLSRVPPRLIYIGHLGLALSLGLMLEASARKLKSGMPILLGLVSLTILSDLVVDAPRTLLSKQPAADGVAYEYLRKVPIADSGPLLFFPIYNADQSQNAAFQALATQFKRPFINSYSPTAPLAAYQFLKDAKALNKGNLSPKLHCSIWKLGVRYIVHDRQVHFLRPSGQSKNAIPKLIKGGFLRVVVSDKKSALYSIEKPEGCAPVPATKTLP